MATIQKAKTLVKRITLSNIISENDLYMTPLLNGPHGIGKSKIVNEAAKDLGGKCFVIEGGLLREGEIGGLPFATQGQNNTSEVRFVKYYVINQLFNLQKHYYEKLCKEGFLNGKVRIEDGYFYDFDRKIKMDSEEELIIDGEDNKFNVNKYLSSETRLKLVESGEVLITLIMIDEMNRTDQMTQREIMNILLNHRVNGFELPWFAQFVGACNPSSQNSTYATNEFDPAQISRMCNLKVSADLAGWVEYALSKNLSPDVIEGLANTEGIFNQKESSTQDQTEMKPDPRAWEMVAHFYETAPMLNKTGFFSDDEKAELRDDIRKVIMGKVGETAGRTILEAISRKENNIRPTEILTGTDKKVPKQVLDKFNAQKALTKWIIASNVTIHLFNENSKEKSTNKATLSNMHNQFADFIHYLDPSTQILIVRKILSIDPTRSFFNKVAPFFSNDVIKNITSSRKAIDNLMQE